MKKVYIDCNILLDWLLGRTPFAYFAAKLIKLTEEKKVISFVSALTLSNTYYLLSRELNKKIAEEFIKDSIKLFEFTNIDGRIIKSAISNRYKDFEDDLHYSTAVSNSLDYIITRNKKDFKKEKIQIMDAEEFVQSI